VQDLDTLDVLQGDGYVQIMMGCLGIMNLYAVNHHQDLAEVRAANAQVSLDSHGPARAEVNTQDGLQELGETPGWGSGDSFPVDDGD
jgi:hypothetical protein